MGHNLGNYITPLAVYDGNPTSDATTSDQTAWIPITIGPENPRMLFIVHGLVGSTSDTSVVWKILGTSCDDPSEFAEYSAISGAEGLLTPVTSTATYGPFIIDVDCRGYTSVAFQAYSCDAVPVETHCVALGYGGVMSRQVPASDYVQA